MTIPEVMQAISCQIEASGVKPALATPHRLSGVKAAPQTFLNKGPVGNAAVAP